EFFASLQKIAPDYFVMPDYDSAHADPLSDYAQKLLLDIELRERLSLHLLQQEAWDLFMVVFMATDEVHHAFWHCLEAEPADPAYRHREVIRQVYERADQAIGRILAQLTPEQRTQTDIFVLSDHGGGSLKYMINFNRWLADEMGLLQFVAGRGKLLSQLKSGFVKWAARAYRVYTPPRWRAALRNRLGANKFDQVRAGVESTLLSGSIDWSQTRAYAMGAGGNIFINLRGREPQGIVEPGQEYEELRQRITARLMELRSPENGEPIVAHVHRREELFNGPYLDRAPDLLVEWADYHFWGRGRYDSRAPIFEAHHQLDLTTMPLTGTHRPDGILIAQGPGIRQDASLMGASLIDLAPTLLGSLSIAPPAYMDGHILAGLLTPPEYERMRALVSDQAIETQNAEMQYDAEEAEIIAEHLRSLGYL
ncbi:MAG: alkaline phosphatase family protein, partial [Anaerolineales bacterium]|nr:alkaline phosphatase family protein [Anaerolineales bacterium]